MEEKVIKLNVQVEGMEQAEKQSQSLKARLKELKNELATMDEGTAEFQRLAEEAGALEDKIGDVNARIKNMASDTRGLDALLDGMQGVTGAFAAGQGAMALFGSENEELEKTMMKVQSAIALTSGVQSVANALNKDSALMTQLVAYWTKIKTAASLQSAAATGVETTATVGATSAMRILNAVIKANPIMWLITGITALVGAVAYFTQEEEKAEEVTKNLTAAIDKQNSALARQFDRLQTNNARKLQMMQEEGATEEELYKQKQKNIAQENDKRDEQIKKRKEQVKKLYDAYKLSLKEENEEQAKANKDKLNEEYKTIREIAKARDEANFQSRLMAKQEANRKKEEREEEVKKEKEKQKQINDNYRKSLEEKEAIRKRVQDINNSLIEDETERLLTIEQTRFQREYAQAKGHKDLMEALERQYNANVEKIKADAAQKEKDRIEKERAEELKRLDELNKAALTEISIDEMVDVEAEQFSAKDERRMKREVAWKQVTEQQKLDAVSSTLSTISNLAELFAGKSRKSQERAFKIQKGVATAQALIDTYKGATAAFSALAGAGPAGPILGAIAAASAIAAGLVNVKKIQSQQFEGGGDSGGGGGSTPSINIPQIGGQTTPPQIGSQNATGINQLPEQAPVKAYVVTSEVTSGQSLERNKIADATL